MVNLKQRSAEAEIMDDFDLPATEINPVLKGLGWVNNLTGSHKSIINALKHFNLLNGDIVADWGCGGGDLLIAIGRWSQKNNINLKLVGIDAAPAAIKFATANCAGHKNIRLEKANVLNGIFDDKADVIVSSLFSHHFADNEWINLIGRMYKVAGKGVIITDLHRHWLLYYAVKVITWLTGNKMVKVDGPLSVKRAFKKEELKTLLKRAGIKNYTLNWLWPFRWQIVIYKS